MTALGGGRRGPAPARPQVVAAAVLGTLALVLSGCLSSGYAYFSHRNPDGLELYFKLPARWKTFDSTQVLEAANGRLSQSQIKQIEGTEWLVLFAASRRISARQVGLSGSTVPEGEAFTRELSPTERDTFSLASLRQAIIGTDPLSSSQFNVLSYSEFTAPGGIRGSKLVVDVLGSHGLVTTLGQVVEVDPATDWLYGIAIGCRASCWNPNEGTISQVLDSWTVKELPK